ncbi:unnamed protein product, partial [Brenthis ino]
MHSSTVIVLACLVAVVAASVHYEYPEQNAQQVQDIHESLLETPVHERSARTKRGLLLLKKKLILGALGLKAAKVGAVGAGVVGALALKKHHAPKYVEIESWSG